MKIPLSLLSVLILIGFVTMQSEAVSLQKQSTVGSEQSTMGMGNKPPAGIKDLQTTSLITLKNGLRLIVRERPETQTAALQVWVRVGSRDEREGQFGISHLLAHLILKGTEDLPAPELAQKVASLGGQIGGGTSQEYSQYYAEVPATNYREMLKLLVEMVTRPALREEDLAKERQVVLTEIGRLKDIPESYVDELALREVFKGHPMGNPIRGKEEDLKKISRDALIAHYQSHYLPTHMVIVAVGNVKTEEVTEAISEKIEKWGNGRVEQWQNEPGSSHFPSSSGYPEQSQLREISLGSILLQQAKILLAIRVMGLQDADRPAMEVLTGIIQLRLFDSIRETHGLAYVVNSDYVPLSDTGIWKIYIEVQGKEENRTRQVLFEELKKIRTVDKGSSLEEEVEEAKDYLKGRLARVLETNRDLASYLGERALFNSLESEGAYFSKINSVTLEEVHRVAIQYIQETHYNLIVLRPFGLIGKLGFLLKQIF
ncbi:MAG TPA: pitrilysin family protein [Candidatus Limnocylindrales bacterium]|nr:pitrilysin family protein [Candidatus Limnocylindrales bacterium]